MGEIRSKTCEQGKDRRDQLGVAFFRECQQSIWVAFFRVPARIVKGYQQCLCEQETAPNWDGKAYEQMRELRELCFERLQEQSDAQAMAKILGAHALRIPRF